MTTLIPSPPFDIARRPPDPGSRIGDLLAMQDAIDIEFEPTRLELICGDVQFD